MTSSQTARRSFFFRVGLMTTLGAQLRKALDGYWHAEREKARAELNRPEFAPYYTPDLAEARKAVLGQMQLLASEGYSAHGFTKEQGGTGEAGRAVVSIEFLAMSDLSLMVKAGVQWGLFGGAIANLGTERHHAKYVGPLINLDLLGCFAMTETGHGSDVQHLETTATYDPRHRVRDQLADPVVPQGLHRRRGRTCEGRRCFRPARHGGRKPRRALFRGPDP